MIGIVTPCRNERGNLPSLFDAIRDHKNILFWAIVDDHSTDGSLEYARSRATESDSKILISTYDGEEGSYQLGEHYASIVKQGFNLIIRESDSEKLNFIGICDADMKPIHKHFDQLAHAMRSSGLGIGSGIMKPVGTADPAVSITEAIFEPKFPLGPARLWSRECFDQAGYRIAISADAVAVVYALLNGFKVGVFPQISLEGREVGSKNGYEYYGRSYYVRGYTPIYMCFLIVGNLIKLRFKYAMGLLVGYVSSWIHGKPLIDDPVALQYFKTDSSIRMIFFKLKTFIND